MLLLLLLDRHCDGTEELMGVLVLVLVLFTFAPNEERGSRRRIACQIRLDVLNWRPGRVVRRSVGRYQGQHSIDKVLPYVVIRMPLVEGVYR